MDELDKLREENRILKENNELLKERIVASKADTIKSLKGANEDSYYKVEMAKIRLKVVSIVLIIIIYGIFMYFIFTKLK